MSKNSFFLARMLMWSLLRRRSRLLIALLGVTIGATVLFSLVTLCYDIPRQLSREFRSYGANLVFVKAGGVGRMSLAELNQAAALLPAEQLVGLTPLRYESVRNHMLPYTAVGVDFEEARKTSPYWRVEGVWPARSGEMLAGSDVAEKIRLTPGQSLTLDGRNEAQERYDKEFKVTGIVSTGGVEDGFMVISLSDMEEMTGEADRLDLAEASLTSNSAALSEISAQVKARFPGLEARPVTRVASSEETVLSKLTALVYLVSLVVLSLTMICVATTMMTVVLERRREIGLKKALGAENRRVAREFLAEGLILGVLGGFLGSVCGLFLAGAVSASVFGRALTPEPQLAPITIAVSAVVTIVACLAPVRRAVDVEPALVLRGE
ncbi:MAG: ABC transporter permease [Candidatus Adiutrix sp.]|jgi:putative ABC transport system permease protein|nr:ABC transporter permease [Candidatus Adiutrix sp.]